MPTEDLSYFQEEEFKKSLARYEEMLQGGQPVYLEADELTDIAEYYMVKNKMKQAMACIDYALSIHPDSVDPLIFLARQKMFDGDWSEAIRIRNKVSDPKDREVMFFDAEMLLRQGNVEKAERLMEMLAEREKDDEAYVAYDVAGLFLDYGYVEQALEWGKKAFRLEPDNEKFLKLKADLFIAKDRPEKAIAMLNDMLDNAPYDLGAWHSLGEAYLANEDFQKALEAADFALAIDENDGQALLLKANCYFQQQDYEKAHELYAQYIKQNAASETTYLFDATCLNALGEPEKALKQLLKADKLSNGCSPDQQQIYASLVDVYSRLHKINKAFEFINKLLFISTDYDTALHKGHVMLQNDNKERAIKYFEDYLTYHGNPSEAHLFVGISFMENKLYEDAWQHFMLVLENDRDKTEKERQNAVYAYLSYCALMQSNYREFLSYLKIACEKAPEALEYTIGQFIPEEVEAKDFYNYVVNHSDWFMRFNSDGASC